MQYNEHVLQLVGRFCEYSIAANRVAAGSIVDGLPLLRLTGEKSARLSCELKYAATMPAL
jgi:hypothetical protein